MQQRWADETHLIGSLDRVINCLTWSKNDKPSLYLRTAVPWSTVTIVHTTSHHVSLEYRLGDVCRNCEKPRFFRYCCPRCHHELWKSHHLIERVLRAELTITGHILHIQMLWTWQAGPCWFPLDYNSISSSPCYLCPYPQSPTSHYNHLLSTLQPHYFICRHIPPLTFPPSCKVPRANQE